MKKFLIFVISLLLIQFPTIPSMSYDPPVQNDYFAAKGIQISNGPCVLTGSRVVKCKGSNNTGGILGLPAGATSEVYATIPNFADVQSISMTETTACAIRAEGDLWCWGELGMYGLPSSHVPVRLDLPLPVVSVSVSSTGMCAIGTQQTVMCLHQYIAGQPSLTNVVQVSTGDSHACAITEVGEVWCWGSNTYGQLGTGPSNIGVSSDTAVKVDGVADATFIEAGSSSTCATEQNGNLKCWGANEYDRLKLGSSAVLTQPTAISSVSDVKQVAIGRWETYVLTGNGRVATFRSNIPLKVTSTEGFSQLTKTGKALDSLGNMVEFFLGNFSTIDSPQTLGFVRTQTVGSTATLEWFSDFSESAVDGFEVLYREIGTPNWVRKANIPGARKVILTSLKSANTYEIQIRPTNSGVLVGDAGVFVKVSTYGLATRTLDFQDAYGLPLQGGKISWVSVDERYRSSKSSEATSLGRVTLKSVPTTPIRVRVDGALSKSGNWIYGWFTVFPTTGLQTLRLPIEPERTEFSARVQLPTGDPVPGAKIRFYNISDVHEFSSLTFEGEVSYSKHFDGQVRFWAITNAEGIATVNAWNPSNNAAVQASAEYDDGILVQQEPDQFAPIGTQLAFTFDYLPLITVESENVEVSNNSIFTVPVNVVDTAQSAFISGDFFGPRGFFAAAVVRESVSIVPPANAPQSKCRKKTTLKSSISLSGTASLKVCASGSGEYLIKSIGAISSGSVTVHVRNSSPMAPESVSTFFNRTSRGLMVSWSAPEYDGFSPIQKYSITISSSGKKTVTKIISSGSPDFQNKSVLFPNFTAAGAWKISVSASNKFGFGPTVFETAIVPSL